MGSIRNAFGEILYHQDLMFCVRKSFEAQDRWFQRDERPDLSLADGITITQGPEPAARGHHLRPATASSFAWPGSASFPVSFASHLFETSEAMSPGRKRQAAVKDLDLADDFEAAITRRGLYPASGVETVIFPQQVSQMTVEVTSDAFGIAVLARGHQQGLQRAVRCVFCNLCFYPRGVAL